MLRFAVASLRYRTTAFVGAFVTLLVAGALVGASGLLLETGLRGGVAAERYAAAPLMVAADQEVRYVKHKNGKAKVKAKPLADRAWMRAAVVSAVEAVPGVSSVIPELDFPAYLVVGNRVLQGPQDAPSWGHAWSSAALTPFRLRRGRPPRARDEVVVDAELARRAHVHVGSVTLVQATAAPSSYRVVGIAAAETASGGLAQQAAMFFSPAEARALAGHPGRIAALGVVPGAGVSLSALSARISSAVSADGARVYSGASRGSLEFLDAAKARVILISIAGVFGGTAVLVAILVIVGTLALTIQQRHREMALLRAIGATPAQIRRMIGGEALVLGILGGAVGAGVSVRLAQWLRGRLVHAGAIPSNLELAHSPFPILGAVAVTTAAAWLAARVATRRTTRIRPTEALTEAAIEPSALTAPRLFAGALLVSGASALTLVLRRLSTEPAATPVMLLTCLLWMSGFAVLNPVIVRAIAGTVAALLSRASPAIGHLAAANAATEAGKLSGAAPPVALAVALACTTLFAQSTLRQTAQQQFKRGIKADFALTAATPGVPQSAAEAARRLAGVGAVTEIVHTTVRGASLARYSATGITPPLLDRNLDLDVRSGSLAQLSDRTAAVSTNAADRANVGVGDTLQLRLGDGTPAALRVVAVYARGLGFGDLVLAHHLVASHIDDALDDSILIKARPNTGTQLPTALATQLRHYAGIRVVDRAGLRAEETSQDEFNTRIQFLFLGLIIAFAAIAAVNALAAAVADRVDELALLQLIGATRRQVSRMVQLETVLIVAIALAIGSAVAAVTVSSFSAGVTHGRPHISWLAYLEVIAVGTLLPLLASRLATTAALRMHPPTP